jgi:heme A synthase
MLTVHLVVGVGVIAVCVAAAILGFVAYRRRRVGATVSHTLVLAQTALIGQALVGLFLLSDGGRAPERMHYAYGAMAIGVALAPWFYAPESGLRRLLWFAGTALLAGVLAVRAFQTG